MKNGIIIPCYNEEKRLDLPRFDNFLKNNANYIICFVNDGSSDGTLDMLREFQESHLGQVVVYDMPINSGKAEAVRSGTLHLLRNYDIDNVGYLDADLATGFDDFMSLVNQLDANNSLTCTFGSRKNGEGKGIQRSFFRDLASKFVAFLIHLVIKLPIKDTQCGAKVFHRSIATRIFEKPFQSRWLFDIELFVRMKNLYGASNVMKRIREISLTKWVEVEGSKITLKDTLEMPKRLVRIAYVYNFLPFADQVIASSLIAMRAITGSLVKSN